MRTYFASLLLALFCCYFSGISLFSHTHIFNGTSVVHSHLGGKSSHDHSESQYVVIDILSHFQSEYAVDFCSVSAPFMQDAGSSAVYEFSVQPDRIHPAHSLRGPPQA